jgi:hypothetical protein
VKLDEGRGRKGFRRERGQKARSQTEYLMTFCAVHRDLPSAQGVGKGQTSEMQIESEKEATRRDTNSLN